jgi:hypothetical protein
MAGTLGLQAVPHELIVIPDGQHLFDVLQRDDAAVVAAMNHATAFLKHHLYHAREET